MAMLIRNLTSYNDLQAKRELAKQLLAVEASNEAENQRRLDDYNNPYKPAVVPPKFRTNSEILTDLLEQEKLATSNLTDLGFNYTEASEIVSSFNGQVSKIANFNANYKGIKKELLETLNPKLITPEFFVNYLDRYLSDLEVSFGHKFSKNDISGKPLPRTVEELYTMLPDTGTLEAIRLGILDAIQIFNLSNVESQEVIDNIITPLQQAIALLPSASLLGFLRSKLTQEQRTTLTQKLARSARNIHLISYDEAEELLEQLQSITGIYEEDLDENEEQRQRRSKKEFSLYLNKMKQIMGFIKPQIIEQSIYGDIEPYLNEMEKLGDVGAYNDISQQLDQNIQEVNAIVPAQPKIKRPYSRGLDNPKSQASKERNFENFMEEIFTNYSEEDSKEILWGVYTDLVNKGYVEDGGETYHNITLQELEDILNAYYTVRIDQQKSYNPVQKPQIRGQFFNPITNKLEKTKYGIGSKKSLTDKVIKHFDKDNKEMMALKKSYKKHLQTEKEADSDSGNESDKESGKGLKFRHKRIKVGGGVKIKEKPIYTNFGKYIIHLPYLTDKNILNVKYPSMGSIPSIKPISISDDFKDFILDILESGKMNERQLNKLPQHEILHFEKVVCGAGLTEVLKLKRGKTDQEKKDLNRYYLLRGEIDAGNNNEKVIKELRGLIVKFMNDGRVHKTEGLNLLMELSVM